MYAQLVDILNIAIAAPVVRNMDAREVILMGVVTNVGAGNFILKD